jgi:hypothetical protein
MNIAIIIHSQTGNTLSVAQKLKTRLEEMNHQISLIHIKNSDQQSSYNQKPSLIVSGDNLNQVYDVVIFGGWVQAFSLCLGFSHYLKEMPTFKSNQTHIFVTHHFPFAWLGGNNAISQMKSILSKHNITVNSSKVFNWSRKNNTKEIELWIEDTVNRIIGK